MDDPHLRSELVGSGRAAVERGTSFGKREARRARKPVRRDPPLRTTGWNLREHENPLYYRIQKRSRHALQGGRAPRGSHAASRGCDFKTRCDLRSVSGISLLRINCTGIRDPL